MKGRAYLKILCLLLGVLGCGRDGSVSVEIVIGDPGRIGPADPPYSPQVVYPSGLRLDLVRDAALTNTYPTAESNPFGASAARHYRHVGYFLDLGRAPIHARVSEHFLLSEYVNPTIQRGGSRAYVDGEIARHVQLIRSGLGRPLILTSAFRSPEHNLAVGGAMFSRHIYGDAVDVDVDQSRSDANVRAQEIFNEAQDVGVNFVQPIAETSVSVGGQLRASWVHLDDRGF